MRGQGYSGIGLNDLKFESHKEITKVLKKLDECDNLPAIQKFQCLGGKEGIPDAMLVAT